MVPVVNDASIYAQGRFQEHSRMRFGGIVPVDRAAHADESAWQKDIHFGAKLADVCAPHRNLCLPSALCLACAGRSSPSKLGRVAEESGWPWLASTPAGADAWVTHSTPGVAFGGKSEKLQPRRPWLRRRAADHERAPGKRVRWPRAWKPCSQITFCTFLSCLPFLAQPNPRHAGWTPSKQVVEA